MTPRVALIRGEALNPYETQVFQALTGFDTVAVGRKRPLHDVSAIPVPTVLLHSVAERRLGAAAHRRIGRAVKLPDADRLFGLRAAVERADILHAAETVLPISEQAAEIKRGGRAKLVLTCWETIPFRYEDDAVLAARKDVVIPATDRFLAVTPRAAAALREEGVEESRIRIVPASIDCSHFSPRPPSPNVRRSWGVPDGVPVVLYIGRLIQEKGVVELVRAFAQTAMRRAHLVLVGSGNQGERVQRAARALRIGDRVHVVPFAQRSDLPDVYASADVVVAPSLTTPYWEEQFGMVLGEAMACARPLVVTSSGAIPEVVGDAAALVPPYEIEPLVHILGRLLDDNAERDRLASAGRARVESLYAVPVVAELLAAAYREVLDA